MIKMTTTKLNNRVSNLLVAMRHAAPERNFKFSQVCDRLVQVVLTGDSWIIDLDPIQDGGHAYPVTLIIDPDEVSIGVGGYDDDGRYYFQLEKYETYAQAFFALV